MIHWDHLHNTHAPKEGKSSNIFHYDDAFSINVFKVFAMVLLQHKIHIHIGIKLLDRENGALQRPQGTHEFQLISPVLVFAIAEAI